MNMVMHKKKNIIPVRLSPGLTRTALGARGPGYPSKSGLQDTGSPIDNPGLETAELLDE